MLDCARFSFFPRMMDSCFSFNGTTKAEGVKEEEEDGLGCRFSPLELKETVLVDWAGWGGTRTRGIGGKCVG